MQSEIQKRSVIQPTAAYKHTEGEGDERKRVVQQIRQSVLESELKEYEENDEQDELKHDAPECGYPTIVRIDEEVAWVHGRCSYFENMIKYP